MKSGDVCKVPGGSSGAIIIITAIIIRIKVICRVAKLQTEEAKAQA